LSVRFYFREHCPGRLARHFVRFFSKVPQSMQRAIAIYDIRQFGALDSGVQAGNRRHLRRGQRALPSVAVKLCKDWVVFERVDFASDEIAGALVNYIGIDQLLPTLGGNINWDDFPCLRPYGIVLAQKTIEDLERNRAELNRLFNTPPALKRPENCGRLSGFPARRVRKMISSPSSGTLRKDKHGKSHSPPAASLNCRAPADWDATADLMCHSL
jgi:hypothetical protein